MVTLNLPSRFFPRLKERRCPGERGHCSRPPWASSVAAERRSPSPPPTGTGAPARLPEVPADAHLRADGRAGRMVGRLSLQELLESKPRKGERALDSPDSGLPPSPGSSSSSSNWLLSAGGSDRAPETQELPENTLASPDPPRPGSSLRLCPLSFGEGVEFDPLPPKDIRYTSSVKYDSEKHFINDVYMPMGLGVSSCSQTVICVPDSTWRNYKAEVHFEPCHKPKRFTSTTIVYPKHTKTIYTTTLDYNCKKFMRKFLSSVEMESAGNDFSPDDL